MKLAWNAIVKNEAAVIDRCLASLLPHIDCGIVVDTGSTDGTLDLIARHFDKFHKPLEYHQAPFVNFEQARNEALRRARESPLEWDYLLLVDADMEFRVKQQPWFYPNGGLAYDLRQSAGALGYYNRRLVSRKANGWYVGVTHEYLDIPSDGIIKSAEFIDHTDGANRPDKLPRDVALLEEALRTETRPGVIERYTFYLAGTYFDLHEWDRAGELYKKRVALGGFDEERWYAQMRYAQCLGQMGDQANFLLEMLRAYQMRPQRAEVLHELAQSFRVRGENHSSLLFSEAGMQMPYPKQDSLFINDWVYQKGLKEEFAICAYYDEGKRSRGAKECNKLALAGSEQARSNLYWYLQPLGVQVPSFHTKQIFIKQPLWYAPCNPSVINCANCGGVPVVLLRTVNYTITPEGVYAIRGSDGAVSNSNPIHTRNFAVRLDHGLNVKKSDELTLPKDWPESKYPLVRGFEDSRLFDWDGKLWSLSCVRELTPEGWCEQVLAEVTPVGYRNWKQILPKERRHEKNWMPWVRDGDLRFVYRLGTLVDASGEIIEQHNPGLDVSRISGGSQVVQLDERTWLAVVHEARFLPGRPNRFYQHRFVTFWPDGRVDRISAPFYFHDKQIEFAAGLAVFDKKLVVSYGVRDCEAWTATMDSDEVLRFVYKDAL